MQFRSFFNKTAVAGLLAVTTLAGCNCKAPTPADKAQKSYEQAMDNLGVAVVPEECRVIDKNKDHPKRHNEWDTYDYNFGAVIIDAGPSGLTRSSSILQPMSTLAEPKKDRAIELFKYLPPSANCKAPKFGV